MIARTFRGLLSIAAITAAVAVQAQANGVRGIFPHFDKTFTDISAFKRWGVGIGYDHQTAGPIAFGVEFQAPVLDLEGDGPYGDTRSFSHQGYEASYYSKLSSWTVLYRASYFVSNDGSGFYVGSFLGVRHVKETLTLSHVEGPNYVYDQGPFKGLEECKGLVFPLGIRFGVRGEMDGWYQDLYFQLGYQIGGGELSYASSFMDRNAPQLSGITYGLGYAFGVGW
ncbi:MAG TPA: hypothetical protein VGE21_04125 [Flavobacteriales bacterium]